MEPKQPKDITEYISCGPVEVQSTLEQLRETIRKAAPDAVEKISYGMPAFFLNGSLVYFAVCKNHIGFYPTPSGIIAFRKELLQYKTSKGAVQFPINKPLPFKLIFDIVRFRVQENKSKVETKKR